MAATDDDNPAWRLSSGTQHDVSERRDRIERCRYAYYRRPISCVKRLKCTIIDEFFVFRQFEIIILSIILSFDRNYRNNRQILRHLQLETRRVRWRSWRVCVFFQSTHFFFFRKEERLKFLRYALILYCTSLLKWELIYHVLYSRLFLNLLLKFILDPGGKKTSSFHS